MWEVPVGPTTGRAIILLVACSLGDYHMMTWKSGFGLQDYGDALRGGRNHLQKTVATVETRKGRGGRRLGRFRCPFTWISPSTKGNHSARRMQGTAENPRVGVCEENGIGTLAQPKAASPDTKTTW